MISCEKASMTAIIGAFFMSACHWSRGDLHYICPQHEVWTLQNQETIRSLIHFINGRSMIVMPTTKRALPTVR